MFTAERKRAYLAKHPETAHGGNLEGAGVAKLATPEVKRFTADTAAKTGQSERNVQRNAERGEDIDEAALRLVRGTSLDTGLSPPHLCHVRLLCKRRLLRRDKALRRVQDQRRGNAKLRKVIEQFRHAAFNQRFRQSFHVNIPLHSPPALPTPTA